MSLSDAGREMTRRRFHTGSTRTRRSTRQSFDRIWYGKHWLYAGLEAEVPTVGSYRTTTLGERSVIVIRSAEDKISVLENRCRHRGVQICQARRAR